MSLYDLKTQQLDGSPADLARYRGTVTLVVNVASECGFTPQYAGLQHIHQELAGKGFSVLGFPSNDFGGQEPGSPEQIKTFCERNYGVSFPMFAKLETRAGTVGDLRLPHARRRGAQLELLQVRRRQGRRGARLLPEQRGSRRPRSPTGDHGRPRGIAVEYVRLGHSGLKVSRICLGTMTLGRWGNTDHDECVRIVRHALDEGVTFIDTANRYAMGESEEIVGKALEGRREEAVVAT